VRGPQLRGDLLVQPKASAWCAIPRVRRHRRTRAQCINAGIDDDSNQSPGSCVACKRALKARNS